MSRGVFKFGLISFLVVCEISNGLLIRDKSSSTVKESTGRQDLESDDDSLDTLFKDDKFFTEFDQSVEQRKRTTSWTPVSPEITATIPSTEAPDAEHLQGKLGIQQLPHSSKPESTSTSENISSLPTPASNTASDCRNGQKTFLDTANAGFTSVTDALLGLIGLSTMQTAVYPVIMILVAGVTGFFWAAVFWYLYSNFFKGGGYFGGNGGSDEFGLGFFKKDKYNKYNNYGSASSSAYGRKSGLDTDWDFYTKVLSNLASYGWDKIEDSYGIE